MTDARYKRLRGLLEEVMKCGNPNCVQLAHVLDEVLESTRNVYRWAESTSGGAVSAPSTDVMTGVRE